MSDPLTPTTAQVEPPYPRHRTVLFSFRWPDYVAHTRAARCAIETPHLIAECGEFVS